MDSALFSDMLAAVAGALQETAAAAASSSPSETSSSALLSSALLSLLSCFISVPGFKLASRLLSAEEKKQLLQALRAADAADELLLQYGLKE